ncbi:transcriptional regulator GcvA [Massilia sp. TS11]|uniref:transcriptional regulator GcvA n=1 Tax=Massilia sp. TS11 TaxID=2908003 RepID=UPI001EDA90F8|nr:transcriptional regulator GcvA [Massilia sp. TS11]MCG2584268.1 transcriptional regulator GcvA [Massilia sp. TS11]
MSERRNPPLVAARAFEAAARHLSFLKAAQELHVTPTAISHQVKRLEEYLDTPLFVRLNRAVALTEAGTRLAATLQPLFQQLEDALDPKRQRDAGTLTLSAMPSLAAKWLAPRLPDFEARYPQWRIRMESEDALVDLNRGEVDIALRYGMGKYKGQHARFWMAAPIHPVCSPQLLRRLPLKKPADLRQHTLIHYNSALSNPRPPHWAEWVAAARLRGIDADRGPHFSAIYMALEAALAGHGVALAPAPLVERDLAEGRLVKPLALELENPYAFWIVCARSRLHEEKIKLFTRWLLEQTRQPLCTAA